MFGWLQYLNNCLMTFSSSFYFQFYCDDPLQKWNNSKFLKKITDHWQVPQIFFWYKLKSITAGLKLNTSLYLIRRSIILYTGLKLNTSLYLIAEHKPVSHKTIYHPIYWSYAEHKPVSHKTIYHPIYWS